MLVSLTRMHARGRAAPSLPLPLLSQPIRLVHSRTLWNVRPLHEHFKFKSLKREGFFASARWGPSARARVCGVGEGRRVFTSEVASASDSLSFDGTCVHVC